MLKWLISLGLVGVVGCGRVSPIQPTNTAPLLVGLAGQSNSILLRPFLNQIVDVVGAGDEVTTISCWREDGQCWQQLKPTIRNIDAFVWWQGESDVAERTRGSVYAEALDDLMHRVRAAAGNHKLFVVVMQMGTAYSGNLPDGAYQRAFQWTLQDENAAWVETQDLEYRWWDTAHMTERGYQDVSRRIMGIVHTRLGR